MGRCHPSPGEGEAQTVSSNIHHCSFQAHVSFKPSVARQRKCSNCSETAVDGELVVMYDVNREEKAGELEVGETNL